MVERKRTLRLHKLLNIGARRDILYPPFQYYLVNAALIKNNVILREEVLNNSIHIAHIIWLI
jgi:hypothetical protein